MSVFQQGGLLSDGLMLGSSRAAGFDSMLKNLRWPVVLFLELFEVYSKLGTTDCQMSPNKKNTN